MGRTLPSATQVFLTEQESFQRFRRALRRDDQQAFDALFDAAHRHISAIAYGGSPLPLEMIFLAMLIEQQKEIDQLRELLRSMGRSVPDAD